MKAGWRGSLSNSCSYHFTRSLHYLRTPEPKRFRRFGIIVVVHSGRAVVYLSLIRFGALSVARWISIECSINRQQMKVHYCGKTYSEEGCFFERAGEVGTISLSIKSSILSQFLKVSKSREFFLNSLSLHLEASRYDTSSNEEKKKFLLLEKKGSVQIQND